MKNIVTLVFFIFGNYLVIAQETQKTLDSIYKRIQSMPVKDTSTINLRNDYTKQSLFANPADSTLLDFAQFTLEEANKIKYYKGVVLAYERLALVYQYSFSNPYKALELYHLALGVIEENKTLRDYKWGILGNIATIYYEQEEFYKALNVFKETLQNNNKMALRSIANIANIYGSIGMRDSSIYYYNKALNHPQLSGNFLYEANLLSNISLIYQQNGNINKALISIEKSLKLIDSFNLEFVRPTAYTNAAMVYLSNKKYDKAKQFALEGLQLSENSGNLFMRKSAWGTLADLYEAEQDHLKALTAYKKYAELKDSLNNQNRRVEINRKQMEFDFNIKQTLSNVELQRQKTMKKATILGGVILLFAAFIGFVFYKRKQEAVGKQKEAEFSALVSGTELKALRAQMNPHFIFNSLNSIGDYFTKNDNQKAQEYLIQFAKLMRMVLENSEKNEISLGEDLKFIELYLQVEAKRLPEKFDFSINVAEDLDTNTIIVPPLLLQPFIENSIWHGFKNKDKKGNISIEIKKENEFLLCIVEDNGNGRQQAKSDKKSFGIAITENRLNILNRKNQTNGTLKIIDKPNSKGVRNELKLPLVYSF
ncbi:tetratricopeptide repeat-containing sensor histidine kinase [Yeosuana sp. AK3]